MNIGGASVSGVLVPDAVSIVSSGGTGTFSETYGNTLTYTGSEFIASGLVTGDVISGLLFTSDGAPINANAGVYPISVSGATNSNYTITYVNGLLTVTKAPLIITADNKTRIYGRSNPTLTAIYSGFVLGQYKIVIEAQPVAVTAANENSNAGNYDINL